MSSNFETCYVSCGCNKCPHAADWGKNGLICYAFCNSIAIYDPAFAKDSGKVIHTLHGHTERVNSVRWLKNTANSPENEFVSASADGSAIIWSWNEKSKSYAQEAILKGHSNIVSIADGLVRQSEKNFIPNEKPLVVATSSIDSTVRVWKRCKGNEVKLVDVIDWASGFCLDVKLTLVPDSKVIMLACAAHDNCIHLYAEKSLSELQDIDEHLFDKLYTIVGHDDWIRAMDFTSDTQGNIFLASGSQDSFVRVHKISPHTQQQRAKRIQNVEVEEDLEIETKLVTLHVNQTSYQYAISLETVLAGHEGWVYGVTWYNPYARNLDEGASTGNTDGSGDLKDRRVKLLSSSMDKTLIIWSQNSSGAWVEEVRLGEVGGNTLGFYGGKFRADGEAVIGHGYQGSFHLWGYNQQSKMWETRTVVGGHTAEVMDLAWDVKGNYILTVGSDQTTRLHAPWSRKEEKVTWHELARPQIHGYDMTSIAILTELKFATGAEEKVIRAFTAPNNFIDNFRRLSKSDFGESNAKSLEAPQGASVPALGLSNKPVFEQMKKEGFLVDDDYPDLYFSPIQLTEPPTEENLLQNTLWPEVQKLYGHGYEIYALAARPDGVILASSCKATSPDHAGIILWNAKTWLLVQKLMSHQLTVTQMAFSPNGKYLVSVSRDRQWSLFVVQENGKNYDLLSVSGKKSLHGRVIWCCAWTFDSNTFATGSRDGKIGFWSDIKQSESDVTENVKLITSIEFGKESVTAVAFAPLLRRNFHILSVGLESGAIHLYRYNNETAENLWVLFDGFSGHQLTVKRLAFRPKMGRTGEDYDGFSDNSNIIQMASCGSDHLLKVYDIFLDLL